jgi:hypothetical protein
VASAISRAILRGACFLRRFRGTAAVTNQLPNERDFLAADVSFTGGNGSGKVRIVRFAHRTSRARKEGGSEQVKAER